MFSRQTTPEGYPVQTNFDSMNAVSAIMPEANKRLPSTEPFNPQSKGKEIESIEQDVQTQEYMTNQGFSITIRPILSKVFKYSHINMYGEPTYQIALQSITNINKLETTG